MPTFKKFHQYVLRGKPKADCMIPITDYEVSAQEFAQWEEVPYRSTFKREREAHKSEQ
jgi:hypothetical protein